MDCLESIKFLLKESKVDVNAAANDCSRPLHLAAREGHSDLVQYLIGNGADVELEDSHGRTGK